MKLAFEGSFDDMQTLAETLSESLGCPVTIEDANHRLLAYSSHETQTDPIRLATIVNRKVPEHVVNNLWKAGIMQRLYDSSEPIRIAPIPELGLGGRVAVAVRKNSDVLGYIWVIEERRSVDEQGMQWLGKAAQAVKAKLLQLHTQKRQHMQGLQEFIWQLFTGHYSTNAEALSKAQGLKLALPSSLKVLAIEFAEMVSERVLQHIQNVYATHSSSVNIIGYVVDGSQLLLLLTHHNADVKARGEITAFTLGFIERLRTQFHMAPFLYGVGGWACNDYTKVEASYQEALAVLQVKKQFKEDTETIGHYEELGFYTYLQTIQEAKRPGNGSHPAIESLINYDASNQTELLKTLEVYLSCDCNVKEASERLHVHANTLSYRVSRISEIAYINLRDMNQKVTLYLELKMRKL